MEHAVSFAARLVVGLFLAVLLGVGGFGLGVFVVAPSQAGETSVLILRVGLIGAGAGIAGALAWFRSSGQSRDTVATVFLALLGGVAGATGGFARENLNCGDLDFLRCAQQTGRTTIVAAVVGSNLLPVLYVGLMLLARRRRRD